MLIRLDPVNHFMPSTETKQEIYSLSLGIFTESTMPTIVASVGGSAGRNGKAGFLAAAPIDRLTGAGADGIESDDGAARVAALAVKRFER